MKRKLVLHLLCCILFNSVHAQYTTDKVVGAKNEQLLDSLKTVDYPYLLPIWGKKVAQKGFKLPKSAGMSVQYLWQESDIIVSNLQVAFNNGPFYDLDQIVRFDNAQTTTNGFNIRPDIWLFPFLNIYGIYAQSKTSTAINAGVWVPDSTTWNKILDINTKADFDATTVGFGLTPTIGIGGFFLVLDMNFSWSDIKELDKPAYAFVFGPRLGKNFTFKKPDRNLAVWAGGFRIKLNTGTSGSLSTASLFPVEEWGTKVETGTMRVAESQQKVDAWWSELTPNEQKNPVNIAKYESANTALSKAGAILDQASQAVTNAANSTVQYSLDKKPKDLWNFIIGTQFQINRSWMIRAEYGFLSARQQFIGGLQYRFNL
jgi:hypothetical protein